MTVSYDLPAEFNRSPGAPPSSIAHCESQLGLKLPVDYADFLKTADGGEGFLGENYLILWSCDELPQLNLSYEVAKFLLGFLIFGSDGGGEAYGFDIRSDPWKIVQIPFIGMNWGDARPMGPSFNAFLEQLLHSD